MKLGHGNGSVKRIKKNDARYWHEMVYRGNRFRACTNLTVERDAVVWAKKNAARIREDFDNRQDLSIILIEDLREEFDKALVASVPKRKLHATANRSRPISEAYYRTIIQHLAKYVDWLGVRGVVYTYDITKEMVHEYNRHLRETSGFATYNRELASLKKVHHVLGEDRVKNYWQGFRSIPTQAIDKSHKQSFSLEDLWLIFEESDNLLGTPLAWIWLAVRVAFYSGLRFGDVVTLKWSEVDSEGFISHTARKSSKDALLFCPDLVQFFDAWRSESPTEYVFQPQAETYLGLRAGQAKNARKVVPKLIKPNRQQDNRRFISWLNKIGISAKNEAGKSVRGFHSFRAAWATYNAAAGGSLDEIQERLQHSNKSTTEGYVQLDLEQKKKLLREQYKRLDI